MGPARCANSRGRRPAAIPTSDHETMVLPHRFERGLLPGQNRAYAQTVRQNSRANGPWADPRGIKTHPERNEIRPEHMDKRRNLEQKSRRASDRMEMERLWLHVRAT